MAAKLEMMFNDAKFDELKFNESKLASKLAVTEQANNWCKHLNEAQFRAAMKCEGGTQVNGKVTDIEPENDAFKNCFEAGTQVGRGAFDESFEQIMIKEAKLKETFKQMMIDANETKDSFLPPRPRER